jgi:peptide/nickel transport system permease protein
MAEAEAIRPGATTIRPAGRSRIRRARKLLREQPLGAFGLAIFLILIAVAALAPVIATHDPIARNVTDRLLPPSSQYWFGTDNHGRDIYSRVVYGARTSLFIGVGTVALGTTTGALLGIISAYYRRFDMIFQRLVDAIIAVPLFLLALAIVAVLGPSSRNVIVALAVAFVPIAARVLRSQALSIKERPFVEAARASGATDVRILIRHIAPNCFAPFIILASSGLALAILIEAALSFVGTGTTEPTASWGLMLNRAQQYVTQAWWMSVFPGVAITLVVLGFSLFGDSLRDVLDPRLRGSR